MLGASTRQAVVLPEVSGGSRRDGAKLVVKRMRAREEQMLTARFI